MSNNKKLINALTYNISWATQLNINAGTEKDFVEECKKVYKSGGKQCINNAIKLIKELPELDIMGLQEVSSEIEAKIMKVQPTLTNFKRGKSGLSQVSLIWNKNKLGKVIESNVIELATKENDYRPCLTILLDKDKHKTLIICLHAPNPNNNILLSNGNLKKISIGKPLIKKALNDETTHIICLGDFNDHYSTITKSTPIILKSSKTKSRKLSTQRSKKNLQNSLKSCCWHKKGHQYGHFSGTGDYVIVSQNLKINKLEIPDDFDYIHRTKNLYSDHKPVFAEITF